MSSTSQNPSIPQSGKKGLTKEVLFGIKKYQCKLISAHSGRIPGSEEEMPIMEVEFIDKNLPNTVDSEQSYLYGPISNEVATKIAEAGQELDNGDVILEMPAPRKNKKVNWLTVY